MTLSDLLPLFFGIKSSQYQGKYKFSFDRKIYSYYIIKILNNLYNLLYRSQLTDQLFIIQIFNQL
jgi:hypothetical protein